ncbi:hypothetical protein GCM10009760_16590 [Kitasatospora kazusensis]|uniref:HTH cro/C1-type domain-containing protein n=1 Tax=Kitasatospora kazusensis TaxID=407974 RepID=A0ABN2Z4V0_9ACTN
MSQLRRPGTLTSRSVTQQRAQEVSVTGHVFRKIREQLALTQESAAEAISVDKATIQGWESGRRPLASTRAANLRSLRRTLLRLGADPTMLLLLDDALDADLLISHALAGPPSPEINQHPLSSWVFTRDVAHLIAWALVGVEPSSIPRPPSGAPRRRGPAPVSPEMTAAERSAFFTHMRRAAELADHTAEQGALLRRQALYLCSYDTATDTGPWLAEMRKHQPGLRDGRWTPHWADVRSVAASLTRHGDRDTLRSFIAHGIDDDAGETANLNYWAYWLGLDPHPQPDDSFMVTRSTSAWDGLSLLRLLSNRLQPDLGCIDLNVHSVWALVASRRGVLLADPQLNRLLGERITALLDQDTISKQSRRELHAVHYGLKLHA